MKKKVKIIFRCFVCEKTMENVETELAVDEKGNCIISESEQLTDDDSHFICKECWIKVKRFCNI